MIDYGRVDDTAVEIYPEIWSFILRFITQINPEYFNNMHKVTFDR